MWPQFGDDVLEETLSISEGARQNLNRKKEGMSDFHRGNLEHHGLAPREEARPPPLEDPGPPAEAMEMRLNDRGDDPPHFPRLQRGVPGAAVPGAVHYGDDDLAYTTPDYPMAPPRSSIQEGLQAPTSDTQATPLRAREYFRTQPVGPGGLQTQATPQFASDMRVDEINDADIVTRVDKRAREDKEERKVKVKTEPVKLEPVKTEVKVKQEGVPSHRGPGSTPSSSSAAPDEDVQTLRVHFNNNEDMSYWEGASGNEMKAQLNLRYPQLVNSWQYKSRPQLISTIRGLIRKNQWIQGDSEAEPSRAPEARAGRSPVQPSPATAALDDDEVEVSGISWDQNTDPAYWDQQSSNYIRQQLTKKWPTQRIRFAFLKERKDYIDMITDLIRQGKYP